MTSNAPYIIQHRLLSIISIISDSRVLTPQFLKVISNTMQKQKIDYELVFVFMRSHPDIWAFAKKLTKTYPHIQCYCLYDCQDEAVALYAGLNHAIGDQVVLLRPGIDNPACLPKLIKAIDKGVDMAFVRVIKKYKPLCLSNGFNRLFLWLHKRIFRVDLEKEAPYFRIMTRKVVNFLLHHAAKLHIYQALPVMTGFSSSMIDDPNPLPKLPHRTQKPFKYYWSILLSKPTLLRTTLVSLVLISTINFLISLILKVSAGYEMLSLTLVFVSLSLFLMTEYILALVAMTPQHPHYLISKEFISPLLFQGKTNVLESDPNT